VRIRKHRHRWSRELAPWMENGIRVEFVFCKTKGCEFSYEQLLLFDPEKFGRAA
jgi:hypothetical protein